MREDGAGGDLIAFTNVADDDSTVFHLARNGYGTVAEIEEWDTSRFLDAVEFEQIRQDLERYHIQQARDK